MKTDLAELIEQATVDCYNEDEQQTGFLCMLEEHLTLPFETVVLGVSVVVTEVADAANGPIRAQCIRDGGRQWISLLDLPLPDPTPAGSEWIAAYRQWHRMSGL